MGQENFGRLQSATIDWLRFPLMLGVIMVHTDLSVNVNSTGFNFFETFVRTWSSLAVPLFFFISGYLFFRGNSTFSWGTYKIKMSKRVRSLLVPYLLWNLAYLLYIFAIQQCFPSLISAERKRIADYTFSEIINSFWNYGGVYKGMPILYSFWFIRDLLVLNILSPLLYYALRKAGAVFLFVVAFLFVTNILSLKPTDQDWLKALVFYSMGSFMSIWNLPFVCSGKWRKISILAFAVFFLCKMFLSIGYIGKLLMIAGVFAVPVMASWCIRHFNLHTNSVIKSSIMFVYGFHLFIIMVFNKGWFLLLPVNAFTASAMLVFIPVLTAYSCILVWLLLKAICPQGVKLLTGGR